MSEPVQLPSLYQIIWRAKDNSYYGESGGLLTYANAVAQAAHFSMKSPDHEYGLREVPFVVWEDEGQHICG